MSFDAHTNFGYSKISAVDGPADESSRLAVRPGEGDRFPEPPFNATIWQDRSMPEPGNSTIVRVTDITNDVFTFVRNQEDSENREILVGDQIAATITRKTLRDIEDTVDGNDASAVHLTGTEIITGAKTFSAGSLLDKGNEVFNVKAYGAIGDGVTNDTTAVTAAITALNNAGGGILLFPAGGNYLLTPIIQLSSNTHVIARGATFTLDTSYTVSGTTFRGLFRIGSTTGTHSVSNVEFEGGIANGDAFTSYTTNDPTFNANNHKYVCFIHSVNTMRNCKFHHFKTVNWGSPITLEKLGGIDGTPSRNVHCYNIQAEQSWVGVQYYCNGYIYEDCSVHDIDVKFCYDDCVAIVGGYGGVTSATACAQRIQVYNIRGDKSGQLGAFVKLDCGDTTGNNGILRDINVYNVTGYTTGVNEYIIGIIKGGNTQTKKIAMSQISCQGTWNVGVYAQSNGRDTELSQFYFEARYGLHFQGNNEPNHYMNIKIQDGVIMSRNASAADTVEGHGIGFSAGTSAQGFQNFVVRNVDLFNKTTPINEGATVPSGFGTQGTYENIMYERVDIRDSAVADCDFSSDPRIVSLYKNGTVQALNALGNKSGATTFDFSTYTLITVTATDNITSTFTDGTHVGRRAALRFKQDGTGSRTISKPSNVKAPSGALTPTATANKETIWDLEWDGTHWNVKSTSPDIS